MVKARLMGDDGGHWSLELQQMLRPFVYRRYIDFSVIQSLRNMKGMIAREVRRRGLKDNIKLGAGGIRETEFIVQVFQLIRGGRERSLQLRSLLPTLQAIGELALLTPEQVDHLRAAYLFYAGWRICCRASTMSRRRRCRKIRSTASAAGRWAWRTGRRCWHSWNSMAGVRHIFDELIGDDAPDVDDQPQLAEFASLWQDVLEESDLLPVVPQLQAEQRHALYRALNDFRQDVSRRTIGPRPAGAIN